MSFHQDPVLLPRSVEEMLLKICNDQRLLPPDLRARQVLASCGEEAALAMLGRIASARVRNLSMFIIYMANQQNTCSPFPATSAPAVSMRGESVLPSSLDSMEWETTSPYHQALGELEFRKAFLILSYVGKKRLEDVITVDAIRRLKDWPITAFEAEVWRTIGHSGIERVKNPVWDSQDTHIYQCHVDPEGNITFKGPYLRKQTTHLHRVLGDENILDVRFADVDEPRRSTSYRIYHQLAKEGITVALRHFYFFVYKDGGKEEKKKNPTSSPVKCYFVCTKSAAVYDKEKPCKILNKPIHEARSMFMHVHNVPSLAKYMARFSLILSKTNKLEVDLSSVNIEFIEDIPCLDEHGNEMSNLDGEPMIHTDGTGFISEDLALKCQKKIHKGAHLPSGCLEGYLNLEKLDGSSRLKQYQYLIAEPPLLVQFRLFFKGYAVKGTVLVNKKLRPNTIQIRRLSMVKVEGDLSLPNGESFNSFEIVGVSNQPRNAYLSKSLITLLHFGGVPTEYFVQLLKNALEDAQNIYFNEKAALRVALRHGAMDNFLLATMIASGIPLDESHLQHRLSVLMKEERKGFMEGRIPLTGCHYLMGTADPTGLLTPSQVCVILENKQISGQVLVYKHPGLHFGDIHVLTATYVKDIEAIVGNAKYAIFFPTSGPRSVADEIANSDFDGDMYWISTNPQLLEFFRPSQPWERNSTMKKQHQSMTTQSTAEYLECQLFEMFLRDRFESSPVVGIAADGWLVYMDRLLTLGDECADEKLCLVRKMLQLVDIYYDALDAPKSGIKVAIPPGLKPQKYPHFMERINNSYTSKSVLGILYDMVKTFQSEDLSSKKVCELSCFKEEIPAACLELWGSRYEQYRLEMTNALSTKEKDLKNAAAERVIQKYKQLLYGAAEFEKSTRNKEDIYNEACAIYSIAYSYAKCTGDAAKCGFPWKVAGQALCDLYLVKSGDRIACSRTFLQKVFCC